jgi:DNA-nicking Smr family endonuclease
MRGARLRRLEDLAGLRDDLAERARTRRARAQQQQRVQEQAQQATGDFRSAMDELGVAPLAPPPRVHHAPARHEPHARSRAQDDAAVLVESVSDEIDVERLLDTDDALSYRRDGIGPDVLRKLRRGAWVIQAEIDLHGLRVDEARAALGEFLREVTRRGQRCVRVVHGKGLGSKHRTPVLKQKVRAWLMQRDEVIAFCQARGAEGGAGALVVLMRPASAGKG